ncbi:MAG TPA: hypothetical protein DC054_14865 [Blastocatellia bacterium]|nr:hypothetical protein [Blastocatellia bacterium]
MVSESSSIGAIVSNTGDQQQAFTAEFVQLLTLHDSLPDDNDWGAVRRSKIGCSRRARSTQTFMRLFESMNWPAILLLLFLFGVPAAGRQSNPPDCAHVTITMKTEGNSLKSREIGW